MLRQIPGMANAVVVQETGSEIDDGTSRAPWLGYVLEYTCNSVSVFCIHNNIGYHLQASY